MNPSFLPPKRPARLLALMVLAVAVAAPVSLAARQKKSHRIKATVTASILQTGAGTPSQTARFTAFDKRGSVSGTSTVTFGTGPNNVQTLSGNGKITSGTGAYRRARGTIAITGTTDANRIIHLTATGSVRY